MLLDFGFLFRCSLCAVMSFRHLNMGMLCPMPFKDLHLVRQYNRNTSENQTNKVWQSPWWNYEFMSALDYELISFVSPRVLYIDAIADRGNSGYFDLVYIPRLQWT